MQQYPLLQTKLHIPPIRPELVSRPRLIEQLNAGLGQNGIRGSLGFGRKLTVISAPAGFGKTTLVTQWLKSVQCPSTWLSLDESDNDVTRFLTYFAAALQASEPQQEQVGLIGQGALSVLQSSQPPPAEVVLTSLINDLAALPGRMVFVLDDCHLIETQAVCDALSFLLEHLPPQMHLVIATREDPNLPLARLRAKGQLTELRASDLRFTSSEADEFLNQVMGLDLSAQDIATLAARTEGWIAGLQLAALAVQGDALQGTTSTPEQRDSSSLIRSFRGTHRYVLDYLIEEVLEQQSESVRAFLLKTAILDRLTGPLCDAVCFGYAETPSSSGGPALTDQGSGQATLELLDRANLFIVPLDNERRWYRYHHLFAELLRQRLLQRLHRSATSSTGADGLSVAESHSELHIRASIWYESQGLAIEAFQHAAAANDVDRAERLIAGEGVPLQYRGAAALVLNWLESLPTSELDARPLLWVTYASALNLTGQPAGAEQKLQAAEAAIAEAALAAEALEGAEPVPSAGEGSDEKTHDIVGHIAAIRAMMAVGQHDLESIIVQSRRALEYLHPDNLPVRTIAAWTLGYTYQLQGDRASASRAYTEVMSTSQASGDIISTLAATTGLGNIQESENQLFLAAESYRRGMRLFGDQPQPAACGVYLGLARILYEWNDLDAAEQHGRQSLQLARQVESIDTPALCGVLFARLKLAQGDVTGAAAFVAEAEQFVRQHNYMHRMPEVAAVQVRLLLQQEPLLHQGNLAAAAHLAEKHDLPISQARVHLAQGDASAALAILEPLRQQVEAKGWEDERLEVMVLQAVALQADGEEKEAVQVLGDALALAAPGGIIRTFVDEGQPMALLLNEALSRGISPGYVRRLLGAFPERIAMSKAHAPDSRLVEPLSEREVEVLQLIAEGLTNQEIANRLYLSLHTVKVHARNIYGKLGVKNRTQAVAKGRALRILSPT